MAHKQNGYLAEQEMREYGYPLLSPNQFYAIGSFVVKGPEHFKFTSEGATEEPADEPHHII